MKQLFLILFLCCWGGVLLRGQSISSVVPNQNPILEGTALSVNISGTGTNFTVGSSTYVTLTTNNNVVYGQITSNTSTNTNMNVGFYLPCGFCGSADLSVVTSLDGQMTYANAINVTCPQLTALNPNTGNPGQNLSVGISGTNMDFGQGSSTWMYFYNPSTGDYMYTNGNNGGTSDSTNINLNIPTNSCGGSYDLVVYPNNNSCSVSLPNAFNVATNAGQITMVNPDTIQQGQNLLIGISGTGVNFTQGSLTVYFKNAGTGQQFYPSTYSNITSNYVDVSLFAPNAMCGGAYDVCVQETPSSCPICFDNGLYVAAPTNPQSITNVTSSPVQAQGGQPLSLTISGTGIDFSQGSSIYFVLTNTSTGASVGTSYQTPNSSNLNQTTAYFNYIPWDCGTYDLQIYGANQCTSTILNYPNATTVNSTLNPSLYSVIRYPSPTRRQLRLRLSGTDIDFMQGSTTLSVRLVSPTTGTVLTGRNINPNNFNSSIATVDFTASANDCGYYNLEISNVPIGCGNTTTVLYNALVGVNLVSCANSTASQSLLTVYSGGNNPVVPKINGGTDEQDAADDLQVLDNTNLGINGLSVQVFPNPMEQQTTILVEGEGQEVLHFALYDLLGQLVKQAQFGVNENLQLKRDNLSAGMYVYRILDATGNPLHVGKLEMK
jgi:hypothetical protein